MGETKDMDKERCQKASINGQEWTPTNFESTKEKMEEEPRLTAPLGSEMVRDSEDSLAVFLAADI